MLAMQYGFTLPADYDMGIIDRRIRDKGPLLDGFLLLDFKAYLVAIKGEYGSIENLYAPFYLWREPEGASAFICSPGFQAPSEAFGRPGIRTWLVWHSWTAVDIASAAFATRQILPVISGAHLADLRQCEVERSEKKTQRDTVLATVVGFEPTNWSLVRFALHRAVPADMDGAQVYRVGHISPGAGPH